MISIDYSTLTIFVPQSYLVNLGGGLYEMDIDTFRLDLKDLEDDEAGSPFPTTHNHVAPITVGGVTLARVVEIINGYTITFENGTYAVNLVGANSNIADVANVNSVSIRSQNSAGLVQVATGSGPTAAQIADAVWDEAITDHVAAGSTGKTIKDARDLTIAGL